ncbi:MAG: hypothetical protein ABW156_06640 [Jiangellaceae bacterium]
MAVDRAHAQEQLGRDCMVRLSGRDELLHLDLAGCQAVGTDGLCWVQQRLDSMEVGAGAEPKEDRPRQEPFACFTRLRDTALTG